MSDGLIALIIACVICVIGLFSYIANKHKRKQEWKAKLKETTKDPLDAQWFLNFTEQRNIGYTQVDPYDKEFNIMNAHINIEGNSFHTSEDMIKACQCVASILLKENGITNIDCLGNGH